MSKGWVALTGTPGTGKTTLAAGLRRAGFPVVDLARFVEDFSLAHGRDVGRGSDLVDPTRVGRALKRILGDEARLILDSHWSHEVPGVRFAIVLRTRPSLLRKRLSRRRWSAAKVHENVDAEAIDLILQEAAYRFESKNVAEFDTTQTTPPALLRRVRKALADPPRTFTAYSPGTVDWSKELYDML